MKRKLRKYSKCFGALPGLLLAAQEITTRQPKEITLSYPGAQCPIHLRLKTSDLATFVKIFHDREYEIEVAIRPTVIIDAGANIGLASIFYAHKYPDARVIALEPEHSNFSLLKKNIAPYANVLAINKALWGENTTLEIVDPGLGKWGFQTHRRADEEKDARNKNIESITVDKLMRDHNLDHIDILKIDIEGAEKEVFQSAAAWVGKTGMIVIELHDRLKMGCSRAFYNATNNFDFEIHKGENVFVVKRSCMTDDMLKT